MANHKSALKRAKQSQIKRMRNRAVKTRVKSVVKEIRMAVDENNAEGTVEKLNAAKSVIDKAAKKGVIHRNNAARKISRLSRLINSMGA